MKTFSRLFFTFILGISLSGCAEFNCTPLERFLGGDVNMVRLANVITDNLVKNAMPPLIPRLPEQAILTSTFVDLNDLDETSRFGRLIQEQIGARLVQHDFTVKELHLRNTMSIRPGKGEKMLSRYLDEINPDYPAQAVVVGTYFLNNRILYITAKLVNPTSRNILAAENYRLCMDSNLLEIFGLKIKQSNYHNNGITPPRDSLIDKIFF